jgi:hypothetical protein
LLCVFRVDRENFWCFFLAPHNATSGDWQRNKKERKERKEKQKGIFAILRVL